MYAKAFECIFDSSIAEDWVLRLVFEDLLKLATSDGIVDRTPEAISRRTNVPLNIISEKIKILEAPDPRSASPEQEGRRIILIDPHRNWGWEIVNFHKWNSIATAQEMRERTRIRVQNHRARQAQKESSQKTPVELPPGFPKTEQEAKEFAAVVGCPPEFAVTTWNQAMARGCKDSHAVLIDRFHYHLATCWSYQQNRNAESAAKKKPARGQPRGLI